MKESRRRPGRGMPFRNTTTAEDGESTGERRFRALLVLMVLLSVLGGAIAYSIVRGGLSAHAEPSRAEEMVARAMRRWATPQSMRNRAESGAADSRGASIRRSRTTPITARPATPTTAAAIPRSVEASTRECPTCAAPRRSR